LTAPIIGFENYQLQQPGSQQAALAAGFSA
jgi:hypothetical protein